MYVCIHVCSHTCVCAVKTSCLSSHLHSCRVCVFRYFCLVCVGPGVLYMVLDIFVGRWKWKHKFPSVVETHPVLCQMVAVGDGCVCIPKCSGIPLCKPLSYRLEYCAHGGVGLSLRSVMGNRCIVRLQTERNLTTCQLESEWIHALFE